MNLSSPFIKRPIATTLLAIGLAIAGITAFNLLPVSSLPQIEFPTINITASFPGASPEVMATSVATPLERQLGRISGIIQMTSASIIGSTNIIVQFDLSRDLNGAARDVQGAINAAASQLPPNLPNQPTYRKVNPADPPIMILSLTSTVYTPGQMYDLASTILQQKLSQISGVGQVLVVGSALPAIRVELNPDALNSYGISLEAVRVALADANVNRPKGSLHNGVKSTQIVTNDQIFHAYEYAPLIIAYRNNAPVRLSDVAYVHESVENIRTGGLSNGKPAVLLVIFKEPSANVIDTVDHITQMIPYFKSILPAAIDTNVTMDRTPTIRASLHDVELTLIVAVLLVVLVTYLFIGNARAALIPSVAVPLSLLGTFGIMYLLGYSLDNLSLMALTISTGFVVDDAVVVLENTMRHIELGLKPYQAALLGAQEVGFTVLSMSTSLIAVFIPILLMGGLVGRLFREFAVTLSIAILVSLIVSLTVTPMMCARVLRNIKENGGNKPNFLHRAVEQTRELYEKGLQWSIRHSNLMLIVVIVTFLLNLFLFVIVPKGFFPQQDTGRIIGSIMADQAISFQAMQKKLTRYIDILMQDRAVENAIGFIGISNNANNVGTVFMTLKPPEVRKVSVDEVINRLRDKLALVPGATLYLQAAQDLVIGGRLASAQFQYTLSGDTLQLVNTWGPRVMQRIEKIPNIIDVNSDQMSYGLQAFVTYDRNTASRFGITAQTIDDTLYDAFGQRQVSIMYTLMNQYHVVMEVAPQYWQRPQTLNQIYVPSSHGSVVPLSAFARFAPSNMSLAVNHQNQFPSVTLSFNLLPGVALGDAVKMVNQAVTDMHLPQTIQATFQGTALAFQESLASEPLLILLALVVVYIVLGILYESMVHPVTILSTLPSAGSGALLALLLTRTDLSIIALIGIILLIGIVKKNAIMMIDFALEAQRIEKKSPKEAIYQAAVLRFRPIMMTTFAALFGAVPLVIGFGIGSELRRPLGITIVGGLIVSQALTLYTTPVIYLAFDRVGQWFAGKRSNHPSS